MASSFADGLASYFTASLSLCRDFASFGMIVIDPRALSDEALLDRIQHAAFGYFIQTFNPANGLVADTTLQRSPCSIAVVGFALSSYPIAVDRGWLTREDAAHRTLVTLRFFWNSAQSEQPVVERLCDLRLASQPGAHDAVLSQVRSQHCSLERQFQHRHRY